MSNTEYNKSAGYLKEQETFQQIDTADAKMVPFLNIYNKGYQAREVCRRYGQLTAQPAFCKSGKRFTGTNKLYSASIALDSGGNERAVLVSKRCGVIKWGFKAGIDSKQSLGLPGDSNQISCLILFFDQAILIESFFGMNINP